MQQLSERSKVLFDTFSFKKKYERRRQHENEEDIYRRIGAGADVQLDHAGPRRRGGDPPAGGAESCTDPGVPCGGGAGLAAGAGGRGGDPENPETPSLPEAPVTPPGEDPTQPPAWILPPEETPSVPALPGEGELPALPPESPIAEEEPPVIEVLVPSSGQVIINPYCLPVELDGQTSTDQIVSAPLILENRSTIPVSVSASVTGTVPPGSGVSFAAAPPMPDSPVKEIFLYAEFHAVPEPAFQPSWSGLYSDSTNQLMVGFQSAAKADVLRLEAGGTACSWGALRLFGSAAVSPMVHWQAGDDIQATFVFSFTPIVKAPAADVPVTDEPVVDMPAADEPAADIAVPGEFAGPLPDADLGAEELSVPGWLFPN